MSEMVCCPLDGGDGDYTAEFRSVVVRRAAKEHHCIECREAIRKSAQHEVCTGKWSGRMDTLRTCLSCVEIRNHFACGGGWIYGAVWEQLEENFFPDMKAGGPCMAGLSPEAKGRLFERRMKWLEESR